MTAEVASGEVPGKLPSSTRTTRKATGPAISSTRPSTRVDRVTE
jgi:hypothetical protein